MLGTLSTLSVSLSQLFKYEAGGSQFIVEGTIGHSPFILIAMGRLQVYKIRSVLFLYLKLFAFKRSMIFGNAFVYSEECVSEHD